MSRAAFVLRLGVVAGALAAACLLWRERDLMTAPAIAQLLHDRVWAPLAFLGLHVIASLIFVPRTVLAFVAGLVFGLWWGLVLALAGGMLGSWAGFGLARWLGGDAFRWAHLPVLGPLVARVEATGWRGVWLIRLLPLPHTPLNYAFGLTGIGWGSYSVGSLLGIVPSTVFVVGVAAAGGQALSGRSDLLVVPVVIGLAGLALSIGAGRLLAKPDLQP